MHCCICYTRGGFHQGDTDFVKCLPGLVTAAAAQYICVVYHKANIANIARQPNHSNNSTDSKNFPFPIIVRYLLISSLNSDLRFAKGLIARPY